MQITIDDHHRVTSEVSRWFLTSKSGSIRSAALNMPRKKLDSGSLFQLSAFLAYHGLIPKDSPEAGTDTATRAAEIEQALKPTRKAFTFGAGRFAAKRGDGDWALLNPPKDVPRLKDRVGRNREPIVVGYFPSIRSALLAAVERTLQADGRTIPYDQLDGVIASASLALWADALSGGWSNPVQP